MTVKELVTALSVLPSNMKVTFHVQVKWAKPQVKRGKYKQPKTPCIGLTDEIRSLRLGEVKIVHSMHPSGLHTIAKRLSYRISHRVTPQGYEVTRLS